MTSSRKPASDQLPAWLAGAGKSSPRLVWHVPLRGESGVLSAGLENGTLFVCQGDGQLARYDARGQILSVVQLPVPPITLCWSADGSQGAVLLEDRTVFRLDRNLQQTHVLELPEHCLGMAISPYGNHLAVALLNGITTIYNDRGRRIARFETIRPMASLEFCCCEPILFSSAEHGLVCCHNLTGAMIWQQSTWSNVGNISVTGAGDMIYLASFNHGIEAFDGDGAAVGSYVLEGTVSRVRATFEPHRLIAATMERSLSWLSSSGELLWSTTVDGDIVDLVCDPLGQWAIAWIAGQGLYRLDWGH